MVIEEVTYMLSVGMEVEVYKCNFMWDGIYVFGSGIPLLSHNINYFAGG
jgi:hypothetical protein